MSDAVGATAAVAAIVELLLSTIKRHQIVERVTMIRRRVSARLALRRHLLTKLLVMLLLHQRELIQLLTTSRSLDAGEIRGLITAQVSTRRALVGSALVLNVVRWHVVIRHRTLAMNFWLNITGHVGAVAFERLGIVPPTT